MTKDDFFLLLSMFFPPRKLSKSMIDILPFTFDLFTALVVQS